MVMIGNGQAKNSTRWRRVYVCAQNADKQLVVPPLQTFYGRQPSFFGCRRQDLERSAGVSKQ